MKDLCERKSVCEINLNEIHKEDGNSQYNQVQLIYECVGGVDRSELCSGNNCDINNIFKNRNTINICPEDQFPKEFGKYRCHCTITGPKSDCPVPH